MRNIAESYSQKSNFWEDNPQFQLVNPFKRLYKGDKSRGKKDSSDLMWAIALIHHPKSDLYYVDGKELIIARDMLGIKDSDVDHFWERNRELVDFFVDMSLTQTEKSLMSWEKRMKQRDVFLSEQIYTFGWVDAEGNEYKDNTKSFDDMQSKTAKFYEEYFKIRKELMEEESVSKNKREKSSTAKGEL
jgi:hypothetical protein